ncbi:MarR family winged helix-turn-helix transcriptional regulator [Castellaniella sp.]|uniref:MarR family winged helix-turn-helix transcriptional regulator n=1 Tax=Castellaniella sp. TaxID=1955812 RepID=UPI002AFFE415|nr:MarR family transcriptional regulator [Castellaniella sp.]
MNTLAKQHQQLLQSLGDEHIGLEARVQADDHLDTRIWLRLLACSNQIEQQIRKLLRTRIATSLRRFDYMAQLDRHPEGLRMKVLSGYLMVTGGNVTGLTDELVKDGLVRRVEDPEDRRSFFVSLTDQGREQFATMAVEHEKWLTEMFRGLPVESKETLYALLGQLRVHLAHRQPELEAAATAKKAVHPTRRKSHD